jgi:hypothetical protein
MNRDIQQQQRHPAMKKNQKARIRNPKSVNKAAIFSKEERGLTEERERERAVTLEREAIRTRWRVVEKSVRE